MSFSLVDVSIRLTVAPRPPNDLAGAGKFFRSASKRLLTCYSRPSTSAVWRRRLAPPTTGWTVRLSKWRASERLCRESRFLAFSLLLGQLVVVDDLEFDLCGCTT